MQAVGYSEEETITIIQDVAKRIAPKFRFAYYDKAEVIQEAIVIGMESIDRYDGRVPLENFLSVHIKNRLKNLKRDKFYRPFVRCVPMCECTKCEKKEKQRVNKRNILEAINIYNVDDERESKMRIDTDHGADMDLSYTFQLIDESLPVEYREDYLKYRAGAFLSTARKKTIESLILEIIS